MPYQNDFNNGRENAIEEYNNLIGQYENFCDITKNIIKDSPTLSSDFIHSIDSRAKTIESFRNKVYKRDENGEYKYGNPLEQITDLAGVRVIINTIKHLKTVCDYIEENFSVIEKNDVGEQRFNENNFGYQSIHYLIKYKEERINLVEFAHYKNFICEIQVRTILQHAWASIEHDIQYKNESKLPPTLQRRFIAIAGLLEIADREFEGIQEEDEQKKEYINAQLKKEYTLPNELGKENNVRSLVSKGKYEDAIKIYTDKIEEDPNMHTLYIGRAKANFLNGDYEKAIQDIEESEKVYPENFEAKFLRQTIERGMFENNKYANLNSNELTTYGNAALVQGDGESAFDCYCRAQEKGAIKPFTLFNKSMACFVAEDFDGAQKFLGELDIIDGRPMAVNIIAMHCLINIFMRNSKYTHDIKSIKKQLELVDQFDFNSSFLSILESGIQNWKINKNNKKEIEDIKNIFDILKGKG